MKLPDVQVLIDRNWRSDAERHEYALKRIISYLMNGGHLRKMNKNEVEDLYVYAYNAILPALKKVE